MSLRNLAASALLVVVCCQGVSCRGGSIPSEIEWDGIPLSRTGSWTIEGRAESVAYIPTEGDQTNPEIQVGLIFAKELTPAKLHEYVLHGYRELGGYERHYDTSYGTAACKVGSLRGRSFLAVHECMPHPTASAVCIELDERENLQDLCRLTNEYCWDRHCRKRLDAARPKFKALVERSFGKLRPMS